MDNIINLPDTKATETVNVSSADIIRETEMHESLAKELEEAEKHPDDFTPTLRGALKHSKEKLEEHQARLNEWTAKVNNNEVFGWQILTVFLFENEHCAEVFNGAVLNHDIFTTYDKAKRAVAKWLREVYPEFKEDTILSSDYHLTGEVEDYGRFFMVHDQTDLGHPWGVPLLRVRLKDKEEYREIYIKPLLRSSISGK